MSTISLPRTMSDLGGDDAADIPDMLMHRGQRNGATVFPDTVSTLTSILPGIKSSKPGGGPISPTGIAYQRLVLEDPAATRSPGSHCYKGALCPVSKCLG